MIWQVQILKLAEIALAMTLGGFIGIEREISHKPAGFRTHMAVAGTSALLMILGKALAYQYSSTENFSLQGDPIRLIQAIIMGISFICAGTIIRSQNSREIEGLTTASTILLASAIGITVALQQMVLAIGMTGLSVLILTVFKRMESWLIHRREGDG
jgi:putative Mg2+ transporter-C (MgtC) family protein